MRLSRTLKIALVITLGLVGIFTVIFYQREEYWTHLRARYMGSRFVSEHVRSKILCWVMTSPKTINTKARSISETWGQHCDTTLYVSSQGNRLPPATVVNVSEGRQHLTDKSREAFRYIYHHHYRTHDWFLKADDDTFIIVPNLRHLLAEHDPMMASIFGHQFYDRKGLPNGVMNATKRSWHSGGAGYVLSKESVRRLVLYGVDNTTMCPRDYSEDFYISRCLENLGTTWVRSADRDGRPAFHGLSLNDVLRPERVPDWYRNTTNTGYSVHYVEGGGVNCCSTNTISFHYTDPDNMRKLYFLIYKMKVQEES